jgi:small subunit ribosomal protein S3
LRANIDYAITKAQTVYGIIGVKVWVFKGEVYGRPDLTPETTPKGGDKRGDRRGGGQRRSGGAPNRRKKS